MATQDHRRSPRIDLRIPLLLRIPLAFSGESEGPSCWAETAAVSQHGALVLSQMRLSEGEILQVQNIRNERVARFKIVWYGGEVSPGRHKLGLEMIDTREAFWGAEYDTSQ